MKTGSSNSWVPRNHFIPPAQDHNPHQPPLTPTYTSPRLPPNPPVNTKSGFKALFSRTPTRVQSSTSLHSSFSHTSTLSETISIHPYAAMIPAPVPVVSSHDSLDDEDECPVCLEPLSFSFRLPGEKPHIVPECGHALHEVRIPSSLLSSRAHPSPRPALAPYTVPLPAKFAALSPGNPTWAYVASADDR
jgi:hypothetical protein